MPMPRPLRWHGSIAVKAFAIAFVATHIPLLGLIALAVFWPDALTPMQVVGSALAATLLAAVFVVAALWRLFRPLRLAADGLRDFMAQGKVLRLPDAAPDEVGRLTGVLVMALAHLDRSRGSLLHASALSLEQKTLARGGGGATQTVILFEVDDGGALDDAAMLREMQEVQSAMGRHIATILRTHEIVLPWGRGRYLAVMETEHNEAHQRVQALCMGFHVPSRPTRYTCSAAVQPRDTHVRTWPVTLQRLEHALFTLRMEGRSAQVA